MASSFSTRNLARTSARHPWTVVTVWAVILGLSVASIWGFLAGALTTEADMSGSLESERGANLLEQRLRGPTKAHEAVIVRSPRHVVDDEAFRSFLEAIHHRIVALGPSVIESTTTFYESRDPGLVSADRRTTIAPIVLAGDIDAAAENIEAVLEIVEEAHGGDGFEVYVSGNASVAHDFNTTAERDLARGEMVGGVIALVILVLVFGAVVAAVVPIVLAIVAIVAATGMTALAGQEFQFSFFVTNMITMMGLAVGIDYSLFVLSRFREERARKRTVLESVDIATDTAGRAVLFSGLTVIVSLMGLLIVPDTIYRSLGAGAIFVVSFAMLASLTLLPALMRLMGDRVNWLRLPLVQKLQDEFDEARPAGFWDRLSRAVMRHPVVGVVSVTTLLVLLAVPYLDINTGLAGVSTLPETFESRKGFEILERDFAGGQVYPAEIVLEGDVESPAVQASLDEFRRDITTDRILGPVTFETNSSGDVALISVQLAADPYAEESNEAIERLRADYVPNAFAAAPVDTYVTGVTASNVDALEMTADYTPIVFIFVLGLSFVLLMLVFRSIVVPAKAIVMNLLSVGAAYGLIVLVSQKGIGADLLGFQQVDTVEFWLPLFLFAILFGLSMDYHVFLLSRIRERYDQTKDNTDAVAYGLRSTGRLITGAALIMVAVFGGFATGELVMLQQVGFGLAAAVLIDATIVRVILVPSSMRLLGRLNWYLPAALNFLPHVGLESTRTTHEEERRGRPAGDVSTLSSTRREPRGIIAHITTIRRTGLR